MSRHPENYGPKEYSAEDDEVARRRFEKCIELLKRGLSFDDILEQLPRDGGTKQECGHTRFDHATDGICEEALQ